MNLSDVSLIVPFRTDNAHRQRAWEWCERRYRALLPGVEVVVAGDGSTEGPFNKAKAVNTAVRSSTGTVLLLGDADSALPTGWAEPAASTARAGGWALPSSCHYLSQAQTEALLGCPPAAPLEVPERCEYSGTVSWGGHVMLPWELFERVNGMDERFLGWGPEDSSFGLALTALCGPARRLPGAMLHLWHPAPLAGTWHADWRDHVRLLYDRYVASAQDPAAMAELVKGNRDG